MKKKILPVAFLLLSFILFTGFEFLKDVELSYKKPLIDLYGSDSVENPLNVYEENEIREDQGISEEITEEPEEVKKERKAVYVMDVKYKTITLNGKELQKDGIYDTLLKELETGADVTLWDDYAEYYTYTAVKDALLKLKGQKKISLSEKVLGEGAS